MVCVLLQKLKGNTNQKCTKRNGYQKTTQRTLEVCWKRNIFEHLQKRVSLHIPKIPKDLFYQKYCIPEINGERYTILSRFLQLKMKTILKNTSEHILYIFGSLNSCIRSKAAVKYKRALKYHSASSENISEIKIEVHATHMLLWSALELLIV